jgi:hypothetical protein
MHAAFEQACHLLQEWRDQHPISYPPTLLPVSDGNSTHGDPEELDSFLTRLGRDAGTCLLSTLHLDKGVDTEMIAIPPSARSRRTWCANAKRSWSGTCIYGVRSDPARTAPGQDEDLSLATSPECRSDPHQTRLPAARRVSHRRSTPLLTRSGPSCQNVISFDFETLMKISRETIVSAVRTVASAAAYP